jgi:hypothetical protein
VRRPALPFRAASIGILSLGLVAFAGCSSSSDSGSSSTTSTTAPEDHIVSDAEVTSGLAALGTLVATASTQAAGSADAAKATVDQSWNQWLEIEGTIKKNDTGAYLDFEDALSDMRIGADEGDAAKIKKGATAVAALSAAYLAKFPG